MKFIEINQRQLTELRMKQWQKQKGICPVLNQVIHYEDSVMDHKHKTKKEKIGDDGKGLLRGILHFQANVFEGKVARLYKRYGLDKFIELPDLLKNLSCYLEDPPMEPKYIHPTEREFKYLKKSEFNKIKKYYFAVYPRRKVFPFIFRKKMKITKTLKEALQKINKYIGDKNG